MPDKIPRLQVFIILFLVNAIIWVEVIKDVRLLLSHAG